MRLDLHLNICNSKVFNFLVNLLNLPKNEYLNISLTCFLFLRNQYNYVEFFFIYCVLQNCELTI